MKITRKEFEKLSETEKRKAIIAIINGKIKLEEDTKDEKRD